VRRFVVFRPLNGIQFALFNSGGFRPTFVASNGFARREIDVTFSAKNGSQEEGHVMNALTYNAIGLIVATLLFVPLAPSAARADDDDDWEDRWEEYEDDWDDDDDDDGWRRWHRHYRHDGYRGYYYPETRHYGYYGRPVYRHYYYPHGRRTVRYYDYHPRHYYGGDVHAGPVDVHYGRHGAVRVGPIHVYW
jgi:hypothetical protein